MTDDNAGVLNEAQKKFCIAYAACERGTDAYLHAYPTTNRSVAAANANRLLRKAKIRSYIGKLKDSKNAKIAIANAQIIDESIQTIQALIAVTQKTLLVINQQIPNPSDKEAIKRFRPSHSLAISTSIRNCAAIIFAVPDAKLRLVGGDAIAEEIANRIKQGEYYLEPEDAIEFEDSSL